MDYEKKYKEALERAREFQHDNCWVTSIFPELKESEDEKMLREIKRYIKEQGDKPTGLPDGNVAVSDMLAWLEKQKVTDEEIIFRPVVGTDIRIAAKQALEKIDIGKKVVLAFNGAYIPVNGKTVGEIDSEYDAWLEKQGKQKLINYADEEIVEAVKDTSVLDMVEPNPAWSEEDIKALNRISTILVDASEVKNWWKEYRLIEREEMIRLTNFLKSLIDRIHPQPTEWSEEDEYVYNEILKRVADKKLYEHDLEYIYKWLKSLKPQPHWKPSEEQIQALEYQVNSTYIGSWQYKASKELLEQLKKL